MTYAKTDLQLVSLFVLNTAILLVHIYCNCQNMYYFFQLTIIGQFITILNFLLSLLLHERKSEGAVRTILSRFHLLGLSLEVVIAIGFWSLRVFFRKGILKDGEEYTLLTELLSVWVHGGSLLTLFYFIKADQIVMEKNNSIKFILHLCWGIPFMGLQYLRWLLSGEHVYDFVKYLSWIEILIFYLVLYFIAVGIDYMLSLRHGLNLSMKHMSVNHMNIVDLEKEKQQDEKKAYEAEKNEKKQ